MKRRVTFFIMVASLLMVHFVEAEKWEYEVVTYNEKNDHTFSFDANTLVCTYFSSHLENRFSLRDLADTNFNVDRFYHSNKKEKKTCNFEIFLNAYFDLKDQCEEQRVALLNCGSYLNELERWQVCKSYREDFVELHEKALALCGFYGCKEVKSYLRRKEDLLKRRLDVIEVKIAEGKKFYSSLSYNFLERRSYQFSHFYNEKDSLSSYFLLHAKQIVKDYERKIRCMDYFLALHERENACFDVDVIDVLFDVDVLDVLNVIDRNLKCIREYLFPSPRLSVNGEPFGEDLDF